MTVLFTQILAEFVLETVIFLVVVPLDQTVHAVEHRQPHLDHIIMLDAHIMDSSLQLEHHGTMEGVLIVVNRFI